MEPKNVDGQQAMQRMWRESRHARQVLLLLRLKAMTEVSIADTRICGTCGAPSSDSQFCEQCGASLDAPQQQAVIASGDRFTLDSIIFEVLRRQPEGDWAARSDDGRHFLVSEWPLAPAEDAALSPSATGDLPGNPVPRDEESHDEVDAARIEVPPVADPHPSGDDLGADQPDPPAVAIEPPDQASVDAAEGMTTAVSSPDGGPTPGAVRESSDRDAALPLTSISTDRNVDLGHIAALLAAVEHPSLPATHYIGRHPSVPVDLLFLEYDATGEWLPALNLGSSDICRLGGQIAQALSSVHRAGFVLLSLRGDAVRWSSENARATIARLDAVTPIGHEGRARNWGTWTAPEGSASIPAAPAADVFSLGMILGTALGAVAHGGEASLDVEWSTPSDANLDLLSIVMKSVQGDASERPGLHSIALELGRIRSLMTSEWAAETTKGRVREVQEDSWLAVTMGGASEGGGFGLFVVADGMGGMSAGEVASSLAVRSFAQVMVRELAEVPGAGEGQGLVQELEQTSRNAYVAAAEAIDAYASAHPEMRDLGTTLTAACIHGSVALIVHAGDSRCHLVRDGELRQLTADHTVVARLLEIGELTADEAAVHEQRSTLYRSISAGRRTEPDVSVVDLAAGDWLILTTDGVHGLVGPEGIIGSAVESPARAARALVANALLAGGHDNATAVVIHMRPATG